MTPGLLIAFGFVVLMAATAGRKIETYSRRRTYLRRQSKSYFRNLREELLETFVIAALVVVSVLALVGFLS